LGTVCGFSDVQRGLVAGSHEHVCERQNWLGADAPDFDPLRQDGSH
jgi:hypothetical protein